MAATLSENSRGKRKGLTKAMVGRDTDGQAGRPSKYDPLFCEQARKLCLLGATDEEIAGFFAVCTATIYNWQDAHPQFLEAMRAGKIKADAEVADSLYRRATGETVTLEKIVKKNDGTFEAVRYRSFVPADPQAAYKWLLNRRRQDWTESKAITIDGELAVRRIERVIVDPENRDSEGV